MKKSIFLSFIFVTSVLLAQNPIVPPGVYIADPSAHVWEDGKLYLYGSLDESVDYYCSYRHHVMVTSDMKTWEIHKNVFFSKGEKDEVSYNNSLLFAPDCMVKDGIYYLYYCQPDPVSAEGVAVSNSPAGPFKDGVSINTHGHNQIDPSTFIDDDGQAYYLWGQFTLKMAKMKPNMKEIDPATLKDSVITEAEHFFHEGAYLTKRNGIYYLVYADMSRSDMPTSIGYAMSDHPMGPYTYGGVIVDNDRSDPGNWNNHGSIAEFKGQWYVFYHRATHNSKMMRKACVEPISFLPDGRIPEVPMTSQGAGGPLDAHSKIDAARACGMNGNVRVELIAPANEALMKIQHDNRAVFKNVEFDESMETVRIRVKPGPVSGTIQLKLTQPWGHLMAAVPVPSGNGEWKEITVPVDARDGIYALWMMFYADEPEADWGLGVDWIRFE